MYVRSTTSKSYYVKQTRARLIDLEGVTVCEMVVEGRPWCINLCVEARITLLAPRDDEEYVPYKTISYRRERKTGDGVWIYRRETGPWG